MSDEVKLSDTRKAELDEMNRLDDAFPHWSYADTAYMKVMYHKAFHRITTLTTERDNAKREAMLTAEHATDMYDETLARATSAEATCARLREVLVNVNKTLAESLDKDFGLWSEPTNARIRSPIYAAWKYLQAALT